MITTSANSNTISSSNDGDDSSVLLLRGCELYVTVEPCIMCASALLLAGKYH